MIEAELGAVQEGPEGIGKGPGAIGFVLVPIDIFDGDG
jgi:hypothetical protein